jgi:hypothetical protein
VEKKKKNLDGNLQKPKKNETFYLFLMVLGAFFCWCTFLLVENEGNLKRWKGGDGKGGGSDFGGEIGDEALKRT